MKNFTEFVCAVGYMRKAQKKYFKTRDKKDLYRAWDAEAEVDKMLNDLISSPGSEKESNTTHGSAEQPDEQTPTPTEEQHDGAPF